MLSYKMLPLGGGKTVCLQEISSSTVSKQYHEYFGWLGKIELCFVIAQLHVGPDHIILRICFALLLIFSIGYVF